MTPFQIEGLIDRICGLFPSGQVSLAKAKHAWTADDFLLLQDVNEARKIIPIILEKCDRFPNLKEVHSAFRSLQIPTSQVVKVCEVCDGNGWDTGRRWDFASKTLICEGFSKIVFGMPYSFVVKCNCRKFEAA